jgi:hypothetical protein
MQADFSYRNQAEIHNWRINQNTILEQRLILPTEYLEKGGNRK